MANTTLNTTRPCTICRKTPATHTLPLSMPTAISGRTKIRVCATCAVEVDSPTVDEFTEMVMDIPWCPLCATPMDPDQPRCSCGGGNWLMILEVL
jgi:hypothetical protein